MHILMLSWEYPPHVVGGLARHVADLSRALVMQGHDVTVITSDAQGTAEYSLEEGVHVYRLRTYSPRVHDLVPSVMQLNLDMMERAFSVHAGVMLSAKDGRPGPFSLIHAHDWLSAYAGKGLKHAFALPLVCTIHATEFGRNNGLHNDLQRYISDVEWWLGYEAWRVICCSEFMRQEAKRVFQLPDDKIAVLPNGVWPDRLTTGLDDVPSFRRQYVADDEKMVFYLGRLVHEKGVSVLLEAARRVLDRYSQAKFVIAGKGPAEAYLHSRAHELGIYNRIYFTGYVDDKTRNRLYASADVAVFPSLYEPFGIVALEAMATGTPVVVSDVGGFSEIVEHGVNGLRAYPGNPDSVADNLLALLTAPQFAAKLAERAQQDVREKYDWRKVAGRTAALYEEVLDEYKRSPWQAELPYQGDNIAERISRFLPHKTISRYQQTGTRRER